MTKSFSTLLLSLITLFSITVFVVGCEELPVKSGPQYPNPFSPASFEKVTSVSLKLGADLCVNAESPVVVTGVYTIAVNTKTCTSGSCFWTTCSHWEDTWEDVDYRFSTDSEDPRIQPERIFDVPKNKNCPGGFEVNYPTSPLWTNHKGWSCGNFEFTVVNKDNNEVIGSVSDDCKLQLTAAALASRPANISVKVSDPFAEQENPIIDVIELSCLAN